MRKNKKIWSVVVLSIVLSVETYGAALNTLYSGNTLVTVDPGMVSGGADMANFILLLDISSNVILTTGLGGSILSNGFDIVFSDDVDSDETLIYKHSLEYYDGPTGEVIIWVQVDLSASLDTEFYMHYGRAGMADQSNATMWTDANYIGAWQLSEDPTADLGSGAGVGVVVDATSTSANGDATFDVAIDASSIVGQGYSFDGTDDHVSIPGVNVEPAGSFTISCWFKSPGGQSDYAKMFAKGRSGAPYASYTLEMRPGGGGGKEVGFQTGRVDGNNILTDSQANGVDDIIDNEWNFFVGVVEEIGATYEQRFYLNGELMQTATHAADVDYYAGDGAYPYDLTIGALLGPGVSDEFIGTIDELRIATGARSVDFIKTELRNTACSSFYIDIASVGLACNAPGLPVELQNFSAQIVNGQAQLIWTTASEKDNDFFTIERSANGTDFTAIAKIPGAGTTNTPKQYSHTDSQPINGKVYYKLKQTDYDGKFEYSDAISISDKWTINPYISVYPNPATTDNSEIVLNIGNLSETSIEVQVFTIDGKIMMSRKFENLTNKVFTEKIDIQKLTPGTYLINIKTNSHLYAERLIVR